MRLLLYVVLAAAALWSGYWVVGSRALEAGIAGWLEARAAEGWAANWGEVTVRGFPNRFDATITELELADPETGVAWAAPFFQVLALSYKPHHVIAVWPERQTLASPYERVEVTSEAMRGSVVFVPGPALALDRANFVLEGFALDSSAGWRASVDEGLLAVRRTAARENFYDLGFEAEAVRPSDGLRLALDPAGGLPEVVERLRLDVTVGFDRPWDRHAIERARPQPVAVELGELTAQWGEMDLRAAGTLTVDEAGRPEGRITVRAENWRQMLAVARSAGWVPEAMAGTVERALEVLAGLSGRPETLDAPLSFQKGFVSFGPIPLGRAPVLRLR